MKFRNSIFVFLCFILTSCDSVKVLTLYNDTDDKIFVTTQLDTNFFKPYRQFRYLDSIYITTINIEAHNSKVISSIRYGTIFDHKFNERHLVINYLKIDKPNDILIAKDKREIMRLINNKKTKYRRKLDKGKKLIVGKNFKNIIIRQ